MKNRLLFNLLNVGMDSLELIGLYDKHNANKDSTTHSKTDLVS